MPLFIVFTNYFDTNHEIYGVYSSLILAQRAIIKMFERDNNIQSWEYIGNYTYSFYTKTNHSYIAYIEFEELDRED